MSYFDMSNEQRADIEARGIDYDLEACLEYNPQTFSVFDIEKVLAVWTGERDEANWRWVLSMKDGRFLFLEGGCDYTGWDCQSGVEACAFAETPELAAEHATTVDNYEKNNSEVRDDLRRQLANGKDETWREKTERDLGIRPEPAP